MVRSRRLEVVGEREDGRARVSFSRACSLFRPLVPSACYAGFMDVKPVNTSEGVIYWTIICLGFIFNFVDFFWVGFIL